MTPAQNAPIRSIGQCSGRSEIRHCRGWNGLDGALEETLIVFGAGIFDHRTLLDAAIALGRAPGRRVRARVFDRRDGFYRLARSSANPTSSRS